MATHDILLPISIDDGLKMNSVRREALRFRIDQYLDDWLPPVLARLVHKVRYRLGWT